MKRLIRAILITLFLGLTCSHGNVNAEVKELPFFQDSSTYAWYIQFVLVGNPVITDEHIELYDEAMKVVERLEKKQNKKSQEWFIKKVFFKIHSKFLKNYEPHAKFTDLVNGKYNCLSATAFYMIILKELDIEYKVIEKKNHVFIALDGDTPIVLETTDPINGYEINTREITKKLSSGDIFTHSLDFRQILGLMYFNQAALTYGVDSMSVTNKYISLANQFYNGKRLRLMRNFIANDIRND